MREYIEKSKKIAKGISEIEGANIGTVGAVVLYNLTELFNVLFRDEFIFEMITFLVGIRTHINKLVLMII